MKQCDTPTIEKMLGWGGAGYAGVRGSLVCDEYPASYIGNALHTYDDFCPKPEDE
jgi:hypothetical protein